MKKLVLAALVGVAFTGCVQNEEFAPKPQKEISFEVANKVHSTRVGAFATTETFAANAWVTDGGTTKQLIKDEVVSYGTADLDHDSNDSTAPLTSYWKTANPYYWPLEGTVDFICYYPTGVKPNITYSYTGADKLTYTDYKVANDDVMYADKAVRYSANKSATDNGTDFGIAGYGFTGVPTLFHHALAKLNFKVQNGNHDDGVYYWKVTVKSITANNIHKKGSVTLNHSGNVVDASYGDWELPDPAVWTPSSPAVTNEPYTWDPASDVVLADATITPFDAKTVYVMPQTLTAGAGAQSVTVVYTVDQIRKSDSEVISSKDYNPTLDLFIDLSTTPLQHWQMNKDITYTLSFNPKGEMILFAPAVKEWDPATGGITVM